VEPQRNAPWVSWWVALRLHPPYILHEPWLVPKRLIPKLSCDKALASCGSLEAVNSSPNWKLLSVVLWHSIHDRCHGNREHAFSIAANYHLSIVGKTDNFRRVIVFAKIFAWKLPVFAFSVHQVPRGA